MDTTGPNSGKTETTELMLIEDLQNLLPVLPDESGDYSYGEKINYKELLSRDASLPLVAAFMGFEVERLQFGKNTQDDIQAERLVRSSSSILDIVDHGSVEKMSDVFEIINLVEESNPSMAKVKDLLFERGYTATGVAYLYDAKEVLGTGIDITDSIFSKLGLDLADETDRDLVDDALDTICTKRNIPYRDTAAKILIELCDDGRGLMEIIHGKVD